MIDQKETGEYACEMCMEYHPAHLACKRHVQALRAIIGLYAETMQKMHDHIMHDKDVKKFEEAHMGLLLSNPTGDIRQAMLMMQHDYEKAKE